MPVNQMEPVFNIVGSPVIVLQVIGMFPHIQIQDRALSLGEGSILVSTPGNGQSVPAQYQPGIAGAENIQSCFFEAGFKVIQTLEGPGNQAGEAGAGGHILMVSHALEEKAVIIDTSGIVFKRCLQGGRKTGVVH